jgi:hypothetical protein
MDLSRRGFLKAVGAVTAGSLIVPAFQLILPAEALPVGEQLLGSVRELVQYEIEWDRFAVRFDVASDTTQLGVDFWLPYPTSTDWEKLMRDARQQAAKLLHEEMTHRGMRLSDLKTLPIPHGYQHPNWARLAA